MEKYSSVAKYAALVLGVLALAILVMELRRETLQANELLIQTTAERQRQSDAARKPAPEALSALDASEREMLLDVMLTSVAHDSGLRLGVEKLKASCVDQSCLNDFERLLAFFHKLSLLPIPLRYSELCLGQGCDSGKGVVITLAPADPTTTVSSGPSAGHAPGGRPGRNHDGGR